MKFLDVPQSGSIADRVHSKNRAGQYTRNRRSPVQPSGTGRRATVRTNFGAASQFYGGLTAVQQAAWQTYADSFPYTDALGQSIKLTGHQMCVAINANRLNIGLGMQAGPPTSNEVPPIGEVTIGMTVAGGLTVEVPELGEGMRITGAITGLMSSGRRFNKTFWQYGIAQSGDDNVNCAKAIYEAEFGTITIGTRVNVKLTPYNDQGVAGVPVIQLVEITS